MDLITGRICGSDFTSIQERIKSFVAAKAAVDNDDGGSSLTGYQPKALLAFGGKDSQDNICFSVVDYLEMVDWTGRGIRNDKKGFINNRLPSLISQLGMTAQSWLYLSQQFERKFADFAAESEMLYFLANQLGQKHQKGVGT